MEDINYILSCCSTADLSKEHFEKRNISYICFHFIMDGKEYPDDLGQSVPFETFYRKMEEGSDTATSQVNVEEYIDYFTGFLKEGKDILHVSLSSGLSGSYRSAASAAVPAAEAARDGGRARDAIIARKKIDSPLGIGYNETVDKAFIFYHTNIKN